MNRRALLLGGASTLALTANADAILFRGGAGSGGTPGGTTSKTFANISASNSPTTTPLIIGQGFPRGSVPAGSIAVPHIGGPLSYQADNRVYWDDGSLKFAVFRCLSGVINAGATTQVTFPVSAGTYSNTSSNTTADITANSNYQLAITGLHTATINNGLSQLAVSLTMGGGVITGGTIWANFANNGSPFNGSLNVSNGNGSGAVVTISGGTTLTVTTPGSGYALQSTNSATPSFNAIVSAVNSGGNHNGASLVQYAKGPVCDAWRARAPVAGMPHLHTTFYVERWKDGSGNFAYFRAYCVYGSALVDTTNTLFNYTFSVDWKNGSTVIRGTTNSDPGYTNNTVYAGSSTATFTPGTPGVNYQDAGRPDWSSNSAVLNSIIAAPTPTEADQMKLTGLILPWLAITPTVPQPTVPVVYTTGSATETNICQYQPNASAGCRCPTGSGGTADTEAPSTGTHALHWMWSKAGNAANARVWLANARVCAAHGLGGAETGAGIYDPTTLYVPNCVPASAQPFTGMTPTLQNSDVSSIPGVLGGGNGYVHPFLEGTGPLLFYPYHQPFYLAYVYNLEGEQWMADAMLNATATMMYCQYLGSHRQAALGGTTYYGVWSNQGSNERVIAWAQMASIYAATFMPASWSDGVTNIEQSYAAYLAGNTATYLNALVSFTGIVAYGSVANPLSKTINLTGAGILPELFEGNSNGEMEIEVPFMMDYTMMCVGFGAYLLQGTTAGTALATFRDYFKLMYVGLYSYSGSHYLNDTYRLNILTNPAANSPVSDTTWSSEGNFSSPALAVYPHNSGGGTGISMNFTASSTTIQLVDQGTSNPDSMCLVGTTRMASGSRVKLTTSNIETNSDLYSTLPTNFNGTTWYYWKELTATTGQLCTDAGLTSPVTPGTGPSNVFFWVVPSNTLPVDGAAATGTYNQQSTSQGGRYTVKLGTCRLLKALGDNSTNTANAIANLDLINVAAYGSDSAAYAGFPLYGWASAL